MPFDHTKLSIYTVPQLIDFLKNGEVTFEELQQLGLPWFKQEEIRKFLEERDFWEAAKTSEQGIENYLKTYPGGFYVADAEDARRALKEEAIWGWASRTNTAEAFRTYLADYPSGAHAIDAEMSIKMLSRQEEELKEALFEDMKNNPWDYTHDKMRQLYNGVSLTPEQVQFLSNQTDVFSRFIRNGMRITHADLVEHGVVPGEVTQIEVTSPEFSMPQTQIKELGEFPTERTDVFFLGVPRSGKSSVLSGIIYQLWKDGFAGYVPHLVNGYDPCLAYYQGLIRAVATKKPPLPTATDTVSFMKIDMVKGREVSELTIVEMAGEAFKRAATKISGENRSQSEVWTELGAEKCLRSRNRKVLFFVLDYSAVRGINPQCTAFDQLQILESSLMTLCNDGPDPANPTKGCTMSRVETVSILVTKSDLMGVSSVQERLNEARNYMMANFRNFMNQLSRAARKFGCNSANNYEPYFLTFSLGDFYVGNTFVFNPVDSREIIQFIHTITPTKSLRRFGIF